MSTGNLKTLVNVLTQNAELLIYAALIEIATVTSIGRLESLILCTGLVLTAAVTVRSNLPHLTHVLLAYPLLCVATDFSNLYYAIATSVVAALTLQGRISNAKRLEDWKTAFLTLAISLVAIGAVPWADLVVDSAPMQAVLSHPAGKIASIAGIGLVLQWSTMLFFLKISFASFTESEVVIMSQLCVGFILPAMGKVALSSSLSPSEFIVLFVALVTWFFFWLYEYLRRQPLPFGQTFSAGIALGVLAFKGLGPLLLAAPSQLTDFFTRHVDYMLLGAWAGIFVVFTALIATIKRKVSNTILRKSFHFMALAMFLPAMIHNPGFLRTAMCLAITVFCLVEFIRYSKILGQTVSDMISAAMSQVTNERDRKGALTLSHLYLLIGCGFPLLYVTDATRLPLEVMAGPLFVLTVGDSFASIVGSKWGTHRWPSNNRTVEGSLSGILTTLGAFYALKFNMHLQLNWFVIAVSTCLTFGMEAYTQSIDNLILPIFYYASAELLHS